MRIRPSYFLAAYILLILVFASAYYWVPGAVGEEGISYLKSVYFSTVTITTLGYGDVTPKTDTAMMIVALEAILGIVIIGLFLSSLWKSFADNIEAQQEEQISRKIREQRVGKVISFYGYLKIEIANFNMALVELTTPLGGNRNVSAPSQQFKFSDMKDLYKTSLLTKVGWNKPVIHRYYEALESIVAELKFSLSNLETNEFPELHSAIIEFLSVAKAYDVKGAMLSYENIRAGSDPVKEMLEKSIAEHESCPDIEKYKSHLLTPVIILYQAVVMQIALIAAIDEAFVALAANHSVRDFPSTPPD